ncbi:hypothetical protein BH24ACI2_BH24ACI2_12780 [soil metagenome]
MKHGIKLFVLIFALILSSNCAAQSKSVTNLNFL